VNLFTTKLRRTATVVGGVITGLSVMAAMATPALACDTLVTGVPSCLTDDGWTVTWSVQNEYHPEAIVRSVQLDGTEVTGGIGDIQVKKTIAVDKSETLTGVSKFPKGDKTHSLNVELQWKGDDGDFTGPTDWTAAEVQPATEHCTPSTSAPSSSAPTTTAPTTTPPAVPLPSESVPVLPNEIYKADCSSVTIGLDNTNTPIEYKLTLKPKTGNTQKLDIKPGEKKSAKFAVSGSNFYVNLTVVAIYKGKTSPPETAAVPYEKPASCSSDVLAVTGSSTGPLAGGAIAILLLGGGLFFMARRRKLKFTA
jgi:uncharacterized protein (TIGR04145 family)